MTENTHDVRQISSSRIRRLQGSLLAQRLRLIDLTTFTYIGLLTVVIIAFNQRVDGWYFYIIGHAGVAALLLGLIHLVESRTSKVLHFVRDIYPFILFTLMFKEVSLIINIFFPFWLEAHLINWDVALFGDHPTVLVQRIFHPWLTEFMAFSYWSYYLLIPGGGLVLYLRKNREMFHSLVFSLSFTMYLCYLSYLSLTARGPQQTLSFLLAERQAVGLFDSMVMNIQATASIIGAAFPSSHVAAVWVILIFMFRTRRWLGWTLLPLVLSLTVSTVYLQYHYAVDAIAGALLVGLTYPLSRWIEKKAEGPVA